MSEQFTWDEDAGEKYEDFLERVGPELAHALAEGNAMLTDPLKGQEVMADLIVHKLIEDARESLHGKTDVELREMYHHLGHFSMLVKAAGEIIHDRIAEVHRETCEPCRLKYEKGSSKRAKLDDAIKGLLDILNEDDDDEDEVEPGEEWKQ